MAGTAGGRRERLRAETRDEAKRLALRQISESGPWGLSLNAIARQMGVTGPALYRYFSGRDELLAELVTDAYEDLADALAVAAGQGGRTGSPHARLRAVAAAYRDWALSQPHRYLLLFGTPLPGVGPADGTAAGRRTAAGLAGVFADAFAVLAAHRAAAPTTGDAAIRRLAAAAWTRLHGVVSLEIGGHLRAAGADPAAVYRSEVEALLDDARRLLASG